MFSAACQPKRPSRSTSPNPNARFLRRAHLPLPDIDLVPARPRASDGRADTRAAAFRRDASILGADGIIPVRIGVCHVYPQQAFASSERFSARLLCFTGVASSQAPSPEPPPTSGPPASEAPLHRGRKPLRRRRRPHHKPDRASLFPPSRSRRPRAHAQGRQGRLRPLGSQHPAANTDAHTDGNAGRDHRRATGGNVAVQPAAAR